MLELIAATLPKAAALRGSRQYVDLPSRLVNNDLLFTSLCWQSGPHDWVVTRSSPPRWPSFAEVVAAGSLRRIFCTRHLVKMVGHRSSLKKVQKRDMPCSCSYLQATNPAPSSCTACVYCSAAAQIIIVRTAYYRWTCPGR